MDTSFKTHNSNVGDDCGKLNKPPKEGHTAVTSIQVWPGGPFLNPLTYPFGL